MLRKLLQPFCLTPEELEWIKNGSITYKDNEWDLTSSYGVPEYVSLDYVELKDECDNFIGGVAYLAQKSNIYHIWRIRSASDCPHIDMDFQQSAFKDMDEAVTFAKKIILRK